MNMRAVIWSGDKWRITDVGTLKSDNSGNSEIIKLSADGTVAVGISDSDSIKQKPFVVKIPKSIARQEQTSERVPLKPEQS